MWRAFLLLAAFSWISPSIRGYFIDAFDLASREINVHGLAAEAATGVLCFISFLAIRLGARR